MKKITLFIPILLFSLIIPGIAIAEDLGVQVSTIFDKRTLQVNDQLNLTIRITGKKVNIQRPRIPVNTSFDSFYSGRASKFSFINGKQESSTEFRYVLVPKQPGIFTFGPIEVGVNDDVYRTDPIQIEVLGTPGGFSQQSTIPNTLQSTTNQQTQSSTIPSTPSTFSQNTYSSPVQQQGPGISPVSNPGDPVFLKVWVDKTQVYPGQQILLTYSLYARADTRYEGFSQEPQAIGFWIEELPMGRDIQKSTVTVEGRRYIKADIRKMVVFPTASGAFQIKPGSIRVSIEQRSDSKSRFDDFFNDSFFGGSGLFSKRVNKNLTVPDINIRVNKLPDRGRPEEFSGIVGRFNFTASIDKKEVKQNEPITLSLKIEGEGNIETLDHPPIPEIENFKIYEGETESQLLKRNNTIVGSKQFEIIFIPEKAGVFSIPSLLFNYFDPYSKNYKAIRTNEFKVNVLPGEVQDELRYVPSEKKEDLKKDLKKETVDIYSIKNDLSITSKNRMYQQVKNKLIWTNGILAGIFLLLLFFRIKSHAYENDQPLKKRKFASKFAGKRYKKLIREVSKSTKPKKEFCIEASQILDQYLADRFNLSAQGMTITILENQLMESNVNADLIERIKGFYEAADMARFTGYEPETEKVKEMIETIDLVIQTLEKK